jgi:hypothetical protein
LCGAERAQEPPQHQGFPGQRRAPRRGKGIGCNTARSRDDEGRAALSVWMRTRQAEKILKAAVEALDAERDKLRQHDVAIAAARAEVEAAPEDEEAAAKVRRHELSRDRVAGVIALLERDVETGERQLEAARFIDVCNELLAPAAGAQLRASVEFRTKVKAVIAAGRKLEACRDEYEEARARAADVKPADEELPVEVHEPDWPARKDREQLAALIRGGPHQPQKATGELQAR